MLEGNSFDFNDVVHYLATEFKKFDRERLEWEIEKNALLDRITILEGEKRSLQHLNTDIHNKLVLVNDKLEKPSINILKKKEDTRKLLYKFMKEAKQLASSPFDPPTDTPITIEETRAPNSYFDIEDLEDLANVKVEDLKKDKRLWKSSLNYRSHFDVVRSVKFIDHFHFMSLGDDGCAKIWNLKSEDPFRCFRSSSPLLSGAIMHTNLFNEYNVAICGDLSGKLHVFSADTSRPVDDYPHYDTTFRLCASVEHSDAIWDIATFDKQTKCASASSDGTVKIWELKLDGLFSLHSLTCTLIINVVDNQMPTSVCASNHDDNILYTGFNNGQIAVIDLETGQARDTINASSESNTQINQIKAHLSENLLACAMEDNTLILVDPRQENPVSKMVAHTDSVSSVAFHNNSVITGSHDGSVRIWDLTSRQCVQEFTAHRKKYDESVCNLDCIGDSLLSCGADALVKHFSLL